MNVCCCFGVVLKVCSQQQKKQLMKCIAGKSVMTICNPFIPILVLETNLIHNMNSTPLIPGNFVTGGNQIFVVSKKLGSGSGSGE